MSIHKHKQINARMTDAQYRAFLALTRALNEAKAETIRTAIATLCQQEGIEWPDDMRDWHRKEPTP